MRIAIDYSPAVYQGAGVGRFVRDIVNALLALDRENVYTLLYTRPAGRASPPQLPVSPNVTSRRLVLPERLLNLIWYKLGVPLPVELLGGRADVYHFPDFALPPVRSSRTVVTIHDLSFLLVPECAETGLRAHLERVVPASARRASFVTADSENTRNDIATLLDVPPGRIEVVYPGVDPRFRPTADAAGQERIRAKYRVQFPFILYVGTIEPRKNLGRLLRAYVQLREQRKVSHRLVIAGGLGWLYDDVLRDIDDLAARYEIVFLGRVPDDDLPFLYRLADLFVFPSLYEGFGIPPLEAMASGVPVVCSNTSSMPEVVGDAGVMVPPEDVDGLARAIGDLLADPERRALLSARGLERARRFSWKSSARKLLDVYRYVGIH
jgi:glycosyltransferase involved in cell wall biosynthesis